MLRTRALVLPAQESNTVMTFGSEAHRLNRLAAMARQKLLVSLFAIVTSAGTAVASAARALAMAWARVRTTSFVRWPYHLTMCSSDQSVLR